MIITATEPAHDSEGIPLESTVSVTFDEEVDYDSIASGAFVVISSASKLIVEGPALEDMTPQGPHNFLDSPVYDGFVAGRITTEDNLTFTFTPDSPLSPNTTFRILLGTKVLTTTVGEIIPGANTGTGDFSLTGPYKGDADGFTITIVDAGVLGTARFTYKRDSSGLPSSPITTGRSIELEDGLIISFKPGVYEEDDTFTFEVFEGTPLASIYTFSFSTGAASYVEVPEELPSIQIEKREVDGLLRIDNIPSVNSGTLALVSVVPSDRASNVPLGFSTITLTFNKPLDPDSISEAFIQVLMESLPLDETEQTSIPLNVAATVSGKQLILRFQG
jgi:hypothetical protein